VEPPTLFDPQAREPIAHARRTDPQTSHDAARSVTNLRPRQVAVLDLVLLLCPVTDPDLVEAYQTRSRIDPDRYPRQSESGIRTRRSELVTLGYVEDSTHRATLPTGRKATMWTATAKARNL
jgi:hypothetical protein